MSTEEPNPKWERQDILQIVGDFEAFLSLLLWGYIFTLEDRGSNPNPKEGLVLFVSCLAFAFAFALSGLRFGSVFGKSVGCLLTIVTTLVIGGIIYVNHTHVPWGVIRRFWGELLF